MNSTLERDRSHRTCGVWCDETRACTSRRVLRARASFANALFLRLIMTNRRARRIRGERARAPRARPSRVVIGASSSNVATGPRPWISRRTRPCFDRRGRACVRARRLSRTRVDVHGAQPRGEAGVETASPPRTVVARGAKADAHPAVPAASAVPAVLEDARRDWNSGKAHTAPWGRCRTHPRAGTSRACPAVDWQVSLSGARRPAPRRRRTRRPRPWHPPPRGAT